MLTRRQEQMLHTPPPPAAGGGQLDGEPSPATPAEAVAPAAQANGRALPLKSALKTGRKLRPSGPGEEESTPVGAGIKKRVRIHSSSNLVHEFTTSHSTDEAGWAAVHYEEDEEEEEHESGSDSERGSADGASDSSGVRRGRTRRRTASASPSFLSLLLFGEGARSRGGARRGSRRRASSGAWLGLLYTLAWMAASSALIFVNKVLMVRQLPVWGVHALHGQASSLSVDVLGQRQDSLWLPRPLTCTSSHPAAIQGGLRLPLPLCPHCHGPGGLCPAWYVLGAGWAGGQEGSTAIGASPAGVGINSLTPPVLPSPRLPLAALGAALLGFAPLRPPPSAEVAITKLLPVAASFAASLFLGNVAYLGLSGKRAASSLSCCMLCSHLPAAPHCA